MTVPPPSPASPRGSASWWQGFCLGRSLGQTGSRGSSSCLGQSSPRAAVSPRSSPAPSGFCPIPAVGTGIANRRLCSAPSCLPWAHGAAAPAVINHCSKRPTGAVNNHRHLPIGAWTESSTAALLETRLGWADSTNLLSPGHRWPAETPEAAGHLWGPDTIYLMMLWAKEEKGEPRRINLIKLLGSGTITAVIKERLPLAGSQLGDGDTMQSLTLLLQNQLRSLSARKKTYRKKGITQHRAIACGRECRNWTGLREGRQLLSSLENTAWL